MKIINVLVFPAGEANAIELHSALSKNVNCKVFGVSSVDRHGAYVFENYISGLPFIHEYNFNEEFQSILNDYEIDVVFPTHDSVAEYFSAYSDLFSCKFIVPNKYTSKVCRDKKITYETFKSETYIPRLFTNKENIVDNDLPVFIKPNKGQGSVGTKKITSWSELEQLGDSDFKNNVITEYLPGKEYTIDCFTNFDGELQVISPRVRNRTFAGICSAGEIVEVTPEVSNIAYSINNKLKFNGLWYFQLKEDKNGSLKLMEISCRVAGTMCLTRAKGYNLPLMSVYNAMGYRVEIIDNKYNVVIDRILANKFKTDINYKRVYIDFDDTIIIRGKINLDAIRYMYQLKNQNKEIYLITRHDGDIVAELEKFHLHPELFNEIIHIKDDSPKSYYIEDNVESIFIDNAFNERKEVAEKVKIPVFDADGFEVLLDWVC